MIFLVKYCPSPLIYTITLSTVWSEIGNFTIPDLAYWALHSVQLLARYRPKHCPVWVIFMLQSHFYMFMLGGRTAVSGLRLYLDGSFPFFEMAERFARFYAHDSIAIIGEVWFHRIRCHYISICQSLTDNNL